MRFTVERNPDPALALRIERDAGLSREGREVERRFAVDPEGHFVARGSGGEPLGVVSSVVYGGAGFAWIVGLAVLPRAQGRGVGRALFERALEHASEVPTVGLDATEDAVPLYEKAGFRAVSTLSVWSRAPGVERPDPGPSGEWAVYPVSVSELMEVNAYDAERFGVSRAKLVSELVSDFPHRSFMAYSRRDGRVGGFVLAQERFIGPFVAEDAEAAAWLLAACERAGAPAVVFADDGNPDAAGVLAAAAYGREPSCVRMERGAPLAESREKLFGVSALG